MSRAAKAALTATVLAALAVIYGRFDPGTVAFFPKCPLKLLTGYDCPGCGSQRAIHHLLNLEIGKAFRANALMVAAIPYILSGYALEILRQRRGTGERAYRIFYGSRAIWTVLGIVIAWWVIRNACL